MKTRAKEEKEIQSAIQKGEDIIVDNTDVTVKSRKKYIDHAKKSGYVIKSVYVRCPVEVALERNAKRTNKVPGHVVKFYNRILEPPSAREGFDSCIVIDQ